MAVEKGHGAAHGGRRASELATGSSEATLVEGGNEDLHRVDAVHCSSASTTLKSE
jgi:hypothetical protein